ncbi:MAG TPA: twin-arginine translocation signal domain-containing protein [Puia sp.]
MEKRDDHNGTDRRKFLGQLTAGAATMSIASLLTPFQSLQAGAGVASDMPEPDEWFKKIKGKHRIVFDVTRPHEIMPFAWPRVFLLTNQATGTPATDCNVVVVLRHDGIPYAFQSEIWAKYNFGEVFKADDPATKKPSMRNPFWKPAKGDFKIPGFGEVEIGINELQDSGVMFCVCNAAMTVYSAVVADNMKMDAAEVKKEWIAGLLPGIEVMPSGVWAVGRAQEHGCTYCYAG